LSRPFMQSDAMTSEDLAQIAAIVDAAEQRITRNTQEALDLATQALREEISTGDARTIEAMRDMQSEILRGIEAFAR
jgi:predicted kinase